MQYVRGQTPIINVIAGGKASGGDTNRKRRRHSSSLYCMNVFQIEKRFQGFDNPITFEASDYGDVRFPHDDAIVLTLRMYPEETGNPRWLTRILVDLGSSADVLYYSAFTKMGLPNNS